MRFFRPTTVSGILASIERNIVELNLLREARQAAISARREQIAQLNSAIQDDITERNRAERVAAKLEELVQ